jgi:hypothetical protein
MEKVAQKLLENGPRTLYTVLKNENQKISFLKRDFLLELNSNFFNGFEIRVKFCIVVN